MPSVSGNVREAYSGVAVPGAVVTVGGHSTSTGASGYFYLDVPSMQTTITVSHGKYETHRETINTEGNVALEVTLSPKFGFL